MLANSRSGYRRGRRRRDDVAGSQVISGIIAHQRGMGCDIPIVPMPLGTENLLARQFGHTATAESVVKTIRYGTSYRLDAGLANDKSFLIMATCGFDAEVVRGMHLTRTRSHSPDQLSGANRPRDAELRFSQDHDPYRRK